MWLLIGPGSTLHVQMVVLAPQKKKNLQVNLWTYFPLQIENDSNSETNNNTTDMGDITLLHMCTERSSRFKRTLSCIDHRRGGGGGTDRTESLLNNSSGRKLPADVQSRRETDRENAESTYCSVSQLQVSKSQMTSHHHTNRARIRAWSRDWGDIVNYFDYIQCVCMFIYM